MKANHTLKHQGVIHDRRFVGVWILYLDDYYMRQDIDKDAPFFHSSPSQV